MSKVPEPINLTRLPLEIRAAFEAEHDARLEAERVAADYKEVVTRLEHLVKELHQALYGRKSEKLSEDGRQLCFEDLEVAVAEAEEQQARLKQDAPGKKAAAPKRNLGNLPKDQRLSVRQTRTKPLMDDFGL